MNLQLALDVTNRAASGLPTSPKKASGAPAQSVLPRDTFSASSAPPAIDPRLARILLTPGSPTQVDWFFGDLGDRIERFEPLPPSDHAPRGGWSIGCRDAGGRTHSSRFLRNHEAEGRVLGSSEPDTPPFGRWIRLQDGWLAECIKKPDDPSIAVQASMLQTWVPDSGPRQMVLWEILRDGGGVVYRLDAEAAFNDNFSKPPPTLELWPYAPGEEPKPPFFSKAWPAPQTVDLEEHLGRLPRGQFRHVQDEPYMKSGWRVELQGPTRHLGHVEMALRDDLPVGAGAGGGFSEMEGRPLCEWTRVQGGWVSEARGTLTPELFGHVKGSTFRTKLGDDGSVAMELELEKPDGNATVYGLDHDVWQRGGGAPPVREGSVRGPAATVTGPVTPAEREHVIEDGGGWIIVDGVKIPKRVRVS